MHQEHKVQSQTRLRENFSRAKEDFLQSFVHWRIFLVIGISDIRKRYARSRLGQFWLTLSFIINIVAIGVVWSYLFKMPIAEYLPFLAVSMIFWTYISTCITEGLNAYISSSSYLHELSIPKLTYVNSVFVRNFIVLCHNLLVLVPIGLFFSFKISITNVIFSILGLVLTSIFLFPVIVIISLATLRFRDLPSIINALMQIVFYVTPVMWKTDLMPERFHKYLVLNPFAVMLSICRDPLFGNEVSNTYLVAAIIYIILACSLAIAFFSRYRSRIVYWI